jgi:hypothetical protein
VVRTGALPCEICVLVVKCARAVQARSGRGLGGGGSQTIAKTKHYTALHSACLWEATENFQPDISRRTGSIPPRALGLLWPGAEHARTQHLDLELRSELLGFLKGGLLFVVASVT